AQGDAGALHRRRRVAPAAAAFGGNARGAGAGADRSALRARLQAGMIARHGMVASAHPLATRIGVEILQRGGSAVYAAIAVNAALGFLEPMSCGVGGDLFAILWDPESR